MAKITHMPSKRPVPMLASTKRRLDAVSQAIDNNRFAQKISKKTVVYCWIAIITLMAIKLIAAPIPEMNKAVIIATLTTGYAALGVLLAYRIMERKSNNRTFGL